MPGAVRSFASPACGCLPPGAPCHAVDLRFCPARWHELLLAASSSSLALQGRDLVWHPSRRHLAPGDASHAQQRQSHGFALSADCQRKILFVTVPGSVALVFG